MIDVTAIAAALKSGEISHLAAPPSAPYVFREYPKVLFHRKHDPVTVHSADEEARLGTEWAESVEEAEAKHEQRQQAIAQAAAERAYADRNLGEKARAELRAHEQSTGEHVLDVPVKKD